MLSTMGVVGFLRLEATITRFTYKLVVFWQITFVGFLFLLHKLNIQRIN